MAYSRRMVERARALRGAGLTVMEITEILGGPGKTSVWRWIRDVRKPAGRAGGGMDLPRLVGDGPDYPDIDPEDKDALIERLRLENAVLRAVQDVLKAESLDGMSNREKTLVIDRLRPAGKWSLRELTSSLGGPAEPRAPRLPLGPAELPVAHRHHRVQAALRQEGLPVGHQGLLRLLGRGVEGRRETGRRARQLDARGRLRAARARRAPRHPLRPRRPLPLARLDLDLRGARPRQEHVRQGLQPGQRGDGGLLRPAQEGVLARQGLVGLDPCRFIEELGGWIGRYNTERCSDALGGRTPAELRSALGRAA